MWRKSAEAKPSSQAPDTRVPVPIESHSPAQFAPALGSSPAPSTPVLQPPAAEPAGVALAPGASRIAADLKLDGEISGDSDLYIDGELRGKIHMAGARVTVGPKGRIRADIEARDIVINGSVEGSLKAAESVRLGSASRVLGKVLAPRIGIDDGAVLRGMVETIPAGPVPEPIANLRDADAEALRPVSVGIKDEQSTP